ncbi:hypothetical protein KW791_00335 [Candidatus Parcubacteria bacterium]|nr:hypothetical protein [Candidatus Parcubacteria bacterium]
MIKKIYQKLKIEFFYFKKMIRRGVSLKEFSNYYKNKFFGDFLFRKMKSWTCEKIDQNFELHILAQRSMLWPMAVSVRSFLYHSGLSPRVIIHVERDFDQKTVKLLKSKFNNIEVLPIDEATAAVNRRTDIDDKIKKYRLGKNPLILKLTDLMLLAKAKNVMFLGTDVIFFSPPKEIVDFVKGESLFDAWATFDTNPPPMAIKESYAQKYDLYAKKAHHLNSDLILFRHDLVPLDQFKEYFENTLEPEGYFVDMTGFAALLTNLNFNFFPYKNYHIKGGVEPHTIIKHFTGPRRDELYSHGIDLALGRMTT